MEVLETPEVQETEQDSTVITEGGGAPAPEFKSPETRDDAISKALDEAEASKPKDEAPADDDDDQPEEKPAPKAKVDDQGDDDDDEEDGQDDEQDEKPEKPAKQSKPKRPTIPAPDKFLPAAKEHWNSVPHTVRSDIQRVINEYEGAAEHSREAVERYNSIQEYDEIARSNGMELKDTLQEVKQLEDMLEANPLAAMNHILLRSGPRKADGQPVSLYEMATAIVQMGPEGYQRAMTQRQQQQQQQQPQSNPEVDQLRAEISQMRMDQMRESVIAPFMQEHPRYAEKGIQTAIATLLKSGMVPDSLSANERLAAAYDMAVRLNPSSSDEYAEVDAPEQTTARRVDGSGGSKSIRGAPPNGVKKGNQRRVLSRDDAINAAMAALK